MYDARVYQVEKNWEILIVVPEDTAATEVYRLNVGEDRQKIKLSSIDTKQCSTQYHERNREETTTRRIQTVTSILDAFTSCLDLCV